MFAMSGGMATGGLDMCYLVLSGIKFMASLTPAKLGLRHYRDRKSQMVDYIFEATLRKTFM